MPETTEVQGLDFNLYLFNEIMKKTITEAESGEQSSATQQLTEPTVTELFSTPTLTFGEVGTTTEVILPSYEMAKAHGVGDFTHTELLERSVLIGTWNWNASAGIIALLDVDKRLRQNLRNWAVMRQFYFYRADVEVTVRLNTSQFYYGALGISMWPGFYTPTQLDEYAVLQPHIVSASSAEAVVKTLEYQFPDAWLATMGTHPYNLALWSPTGAHSSNESAPEAITISVWARYKNIKLSWPAG